jgi:hypothetical protein
VLLANPQIRHMDGPRCGGENVIELEHEHGFPSAVGAQQGDPLAPPDREVDAGQRLAAVGIREGDLVDLERWPSGASRL